MLQYFIDGGPLMWLLLLCSIIEFAVIIDRFKAFKNADRDIVKLKEMVIDNLAQNRLDGAVECCFACGGPVAAVLLSGLKRLKRMQTLDLPRSEMVLGVGKSMEDFAPHVLESMEKRLGLLPIIASIAPLLGMTGTVTGMISSFDAMAQAAPLDGSAVSAGISEALITTAGGLLFAMPAYIAYNIFSKKLDRLAMDTESAANELVDFIALQK